MFFCVCEYYITWYVAVIFLCFCSGFFVFVVVVYWRKFSSYRKQQQQQQQHEPHQPHGSKQQLISFRPSNYGAGSIILFLTRSIPHIDISTLSFSFAPCSLCRLFSSLQAYTRAVKDTLYSVVVSVVLHWVLSPIRYAIYKVITTKKLTSTENCLHRIY